MLWGNYPELQPAAPRPFAWWQATLNASFARLGAAAGERYLRSLLPALAAAGADSGRSFSSRLEELRRSLARRKLTEPLIVESFALIGAACERQLGLRPYDTQFVAARIMLDSRVAEMATGEGKTLAALLAAASAALAGVPVHVITANDYLAARDAETLRPVYAMLGLRVGVVTQSLSAEQRRAEYACDVTYCTAKELVFDYLRDSLARRNQGDELEQRAARLDAMRPETGTGTVLRGLCMAIVDEADSILIDETRVPLILSQAQTNAGERPFYEHAFRIAQSLAAPLDFRIDRENRTVELTPAGREKLGATPASQEAIARNRRHREESVCLALAAVRILKRDRDYLVRDGRVLIVEAATGRAAPGSAWSRGLHQLVELKEGCATSARPVTVAQITYQRFFARYLRLAGMSGTVAEARAELLAVYGREVDRVPLRRPCRRKILASRLFTTPELRWKAVVERVVQMRHAGRPVLVGTGSVAESEELSRRLSALHLPHAVLNARHDSREASIVAEAGQSACITVATNMAGRGTDIALGEGVAGRGGLHVIQCQHNASRRIDRQFLGRCARRGEPGSCETLLALADLPERAWGVGLLKLAYRGRERIVPRWLASLVVGLATWREEYRHRVQRQRLCEQDVENERRLPLHRRYS